MNEDVLHCPCIRLHKFKQGTTNERSISLRFPQCLQSVEVLYDDNNIWWTKNGLHNEPPSTGICVSLVGEECMGLNTDHFKRLRVFFFFFPRKQFGAVIKFQNQI